jgi:hypothetical protein
MRRFVKDVSYCRPARNGQRVTQPVIIQVRGYSKICHAPKPVIHPVDLGMQPLKFGF